MAQRGISEFDAKRLLAAFLPAASSGAFNLPSNRVQVADAKELTTTAKREKWLHEGTLVVKPDQLIGKKGKNNLLAVGVTFEEAKAFLEKMAGKRVTVGRTTGTLARFLVEPFVPHASEYFVSILTRRDADAILFSIKGGVDIEENWESVSELLVPVGKTPAHQQLEKLVSRANAQDRQLLANFVSTLYSVFASKGFTYLELNPLTLVDGQAIPLGAVARLDEASRFLHETEWGELEFPAPFGREPSPEEAFVKQLDEKTGASLKLTILNPNGSVWNLVAGGGASVVYADAVTAAGLGNELAVYGEYSGDPNEEDTYQYARTVLALCAKSIAPRKAILIGGGIANFTDVAKTFAGIIRAMHEKAAELRKANARFWVRRGGPNYAKGLQLIREAAAKDGLPIETFGPETPLTHIVDLAAEYVHANNQINSSKRIK